MYIQYYSEPSKNLDIDTVTGSYSILNYLGSGSVRFYALGFGSVLGKTWVLVRFVLAGFGFLPISNIDRIPAQSDSLSVAAAAAYQLNVLIPWLQKNTSRPRHPSQLQFYRSTTNRRPMAKWHVYYPAVVADSRTQLSSSA